MKRWIPISISLILLLAVMFACTHLWGLWREDPSAAAERLLSEAETLLRQSHESEAVSLDYAHRMTSQAIEKLNRIMTSYPETVTALKIKDGYIIAGLFPLPGLKTVYLPELQRRMDAESSLLGLANWIVNELDSGDFRDEMLFRTGSIYARTGFTDKAAVSVSSIESPVLKARLSTVIARACLVDSDKAYEWLDESIRLVQTGVERWYDETGTASDVLYENYHLAVELRDRDLAASIAAMIPDATRQFEVVTDFLFRYAKDMPPDDFNRFFEDFHGHSHYPALSSLKEIALQPETTDLKDPDWLKRIRRLEPGRLRLSNAVCVVTVLIERNLTDLHVTELLHLAWNDLQQMPLNQDSELLVPLIKHSCRPDQVNDLLLLQERMGDRFEWEIASRDLLECLLRLNQDEIVHSRTSTGDHLGKNVWSKSEVMTAYCRVGRPEMAVSLGFDALTEPERSMMGAKMAESYLGLGNLESAVQTAESIVSSEIKFQSLVEIADRFSAEDRKKQAVEILKNAARELAKIEDFSLRISSLVRLAESNALNRLVVDDQTMDLLRSSLREGHHD